MEEEKNNKTKKEKLEDTFVEAIQKNKGILLEIKVIGQEESEIIINSNSSLKNKLEYYLSAYDNDLCLKVNAEIRILNIKAIEEEAIVNLKDM